MAGAGISGNGMTIINSGRITGGKGGYGGLDDNGGAGNPTAGAAGIFGSNAVITNSGSIIGGKAVLPVEIHQALMVAMAVTEYLVVTCR